MSNGQTTYQDDGQDEDLPVPTGALAGKIDPAVIERNTAQAVAEGHHFPDAGRGGKLYRRDLESQAFLIVSAPVFRTRPAHVGPDGQRYDKQEVVLVYVRLRLDDGTVADPQLAELNGTYLVNQARSLGRELVISRYWTVARNPKMPKNKQWGYPFMLDYWDAATAEATRAEEEARAGAFPDETPAPVRARRAEIETAGGPVKPRVRG